jgi:hypothetical protein
MWRIPSSGTWLRVDLVWTDVSEEPIASILMVKNLRVRNQHGWSHPFMLVPCSQIFCAEDGGDTFFRNDSSHKTYMAPQQYWQNSSESPLWKPQILLTLCVCIWTSYTYAVYELPHIHNKAYGDTLKLQKDPFSCKKDQEGLFQHRIHIFSKQIICNTASLNGCCFHLLQI